MDEPVIFLNFEYFDRIVDLLLGRSEKATKSVNELIVDRTCRQVVSLILHGCHLDPLVFLDNILLDRVESLFATEPSQYKDITLAHGDGVRISGFIHRLFIDHLVLLEQVDSRVFFRRGASACYQDLG
jgi:hypothetical protein